MAFLSIAMNLTSQLSSHLIEKADLVVMSHDRYRCMESRTNFQSKLLVAEKRIAEGAELIEHDQVIASMRRKIGAIAEDHY